MKVANTLAYYIKALITAIKSYIAQGPMLWKLNRVVIYEFRSKLVCFSKLLYLCRIGMRTGYRLDKWGQGTLTKREGSVQMNSYGSLFCNKGKSNFDTRLYWSELIIVHGGQLYWAFPLCKSSSWLGLLLRLAKWQTGKVASWQNDAAPPTFISSFTDC